MTATINLTAVLITLIICETLYALCKLVQDEELKQQLLQSIDKRGY